MNFNSDNLSVSGSNGPLTWTATQVPGTPRSTHRQLRSLVGKLAFLTRQWAAFAVALVIGLVCIVALLALMPKTYQANARVLIVASDAARDPSVTSGDLPSLATSSVLLTRVTKKLNLPLDLVDFKGRVHANVRARSSIMEINYRDRLAERAITVSNAIADELVSYYDSISGSGAEVTIRKLDRAVAVVQRRLRQIDEVTAKQTKLRPFVQSEKAVNDSTTRLDDLASQSKAARSTLVADEAQRKALVGEPGIQHKTVRYEKLQNDPMYRQLSTDIANDRAALAVAKTKYTEQHPSVLALESKLRAEMALSARRQAATLSSSDTFSTTEAASASELQKADATVTGDRARIQGISELMVGTKGRLADTLDAGVAAERLRLQHEAAKADYLALTARRAAAVASRAEALSMGSLVVVDRAVRSDTTVVGLSKTSLGLFMAALALAIAVSVAFIADALDSRLRRADQIERLYGVPLVAMIDLNL